MASLNFDGIQSVLRDSKKRAAVTIPGWQVNRTGTPGAGQKMDGIWGDDLLITDHGLVKGIIGFFEAKA